MHCVLLRLMLPHKVYRHFTGRECCWKDYALCVVEVDASSQGIQTLYRKRMLLERLCTVCC